MGLKRISFELLRLKKGQSHKIISGDREIALVLLEGLCSLEVDGKPLGKMGRRISVFKGKASAAYIPIDSKCSIKALEPTALAVCMVKASKKFAPKLITPGMVKEKSVGKGNWERKVYDIIDGDTGAAHMLVGETINPPGNWSSSPPHKHDMNRPPREVKMEELYYFRVSPSQGFGLQRIYGKGFDRTVVVKDNSIVEIPEGYHPVVAAPGYSLYYLWILAGDKRKLAPFDDPEHAWIKERIA
jgi:5-deoxy-glucuronate isomerase